MDQNRYKGKSRARSAVRGGEERVGGQMRLPADLCSESVRPPPNRAVERVLPPPPPPPAAI